MIEIALRECRFGGSKTCWLSTRILYIIMRWRKERVCSIVIMINEHMQGYTILYKSITVEKENNCEEGSMNKYVCTYKVTPALFSISVYVWEEMSILNKCACGTRWLYVSDERYVVYQMNVHPCTRILYYIEKLHTVIPMLYKPTLKNSKN